MPKNTKRIAILLSVLIVILAVMLGAKAIFSPLKPASAPPPSVATSSMPQIPFPANSSSINSKEFEEDFQRIENRKPLESKDAVVKQSFITSLRGESGILTDTDPFRIEYVKSGGYFMVEIKVEDVTSAKLAAENWFKEKGLSNKGICNLPVVFYLNSEINYKFKQQNIKFDPRPDGC